MRYFIFLAIHLLVFSWIYGSLFFPFLIKNFFFSNFRSALTVAPFCLCRSHTKSIIWWHGFNSPYIFFLKLQIFFLYHSISSSMWHMSQDLPPLPNFLILYFFLLSTHFIVFVVKLVKRFSVFDPVPHFDSWFRLLGSWIPPRLLILLNPLIKSSPLYFSWFWHEWLSLPP